MFAFVEKICVGCVEDDEGVFLFAGSSCDSQMLKNGSGEDHAVGKEMGGDLLDPQRNDHGMIQAAVEFARVDLGHEIVDIQDDFGSEDPGDEGAEYQEVRHVVDMHDIKALAERLFGEMPE